jgi:hypothetical protein
MNKYAQVAINTVNLVNSNGGLPDEVWNEQANLIFGYGSSSANKGCPKGAFLGLCESGFIKGIPTGNYTNSIKNKKYAIKAVAILKEEPNIANSPKDLWIKVIDEEKKPNSQMEVVCELFKAGMIV